MQRLKILGRLSYMHLLQFVRNPAVVFWAIFFPLILVVILGTAFGRLPRTEVLTLPVVTSGESVSERLVALNPALNLVAVEEHEAMRLVRLGKASLYMLTDPDRIVADMTNREAQVLALQLQLGLLQQATGSSPVPIHSLTVRGSRYVDFLVPGLLALGILNSSLWGIGWVLIEYRMKRLLRRLSATPMRRLDFVLSFVLARMLLTALETALLLGFAALAFGTQVQGSWLALVVLFALTNFAFGGMAIICGSRTDNTQIGNGLVNAITLPSMLFSGVFFSYQNFPDWAVPWLQWLPLSVAVDGFRSVLNEAAGLVDLMGSLTYLIVLGAVGYAIGLRLFRWH